MWAPGSDRVTFEAIEAQGKRLSSSRIADSNWSVRSYAPLPAWRQEIPKDGGKVRVLSIPAIRATGWRRVRSSSVLEPIFEADFQSGSFGYSTATDSLMKRWTVWRELIVQHKTRVIDIDLRGKLFRQCPA